jgi:ribose 5-phosphate isomerase A
MSETPKPKMREQEIEQSKKTAAEKAVGYIRDGMVVGLGTGSTAEYAIKKIADRKLDITGIPTSERTEKLARKRGIQLASIEEYGEIDVDIDGADEVDPEFNLIKGGGGAHTREKRVAEKAKTFIVVVDHMKLVKKLGSFPVAVEVKPSEKETAEEELRKLGGIPTVRENFTTDNGNVIIDAKFSIKNPQKLEEEINKILGVVENGIFSRRKPDIVVVGYNKKTKILERENGSR